MFSIIDAKGTFHPYKDTFNVSLTVAHYECKRALVDIGSSMDILYEEAFNHIGLNVSYLKLIKTPLIGLVGDMVNAFRIILLLIKIGHPGTPLKLLLEFIIVNRPSIFSLNLGRHFLYNSKAMVSMFHQTLKFLTNDGVEK